MANSTKQEILFLFWFFISLFLFPYNDIPTILLFLKISALIFCLFLIKRVYYQIKKLSAISLAGFGFWISLPGYAICALISVWWSPYPIKSFHRYIQEVILNLGVFLICFYFFSIIDIAKIYKIHKYFVFSFYVYVLFFFSLYLSWLFFSKPVFPNKYAPSQFSAYSLLFGLVYWNDIFLDKRHFVTYVLLPTIYSFTRLLKTNLKKPINWLLFFFWQFILLISGQRVGFVSESIAILTGLTLHHKKKFFIICFLGILILSFLSFFVLPTKKFFLRENFSLFLKGPQYWKKAGSLFVRFHAWPEYLFALKKDPFTGVGFGRFNIKLHPRTKEITKNSGISHPHNEFISKALQLGIIGFLFWLSWIVCTFWLLLILFYKITKNDLLFRIDFLHFPLFFIAFWIRNFFNDSFRYNIGFFYYLIIGMALGILLNKINSNNCA